jgi:hypothetical protein
MDDAEMGDEKGCEMNRDESHLSSEMIKDAA